MRESFRTIGVAGVSWYAKIMPLRGLNPIGFYTDLANSILYAADNGADILNMSWGGGSPSDTISDAIDYAYGLGVVQVASAGNYSAPVSFFIPAGLPHVIAVAAWQADETRPERSNFGNLIDFTAPGVDILSIRA